jgi:hypothetical protein
VNSAASWRPRPEVTSPFDPTTPIPISGPLKNFVYLHLFKNYYHILIFGWEIPVGSRIFGKIAPLD